MEIEKIFLSGAAFIHLPFSNDNRGEFTKVFHDSTFKKADIDFVLKESYFSISNKDVIRGMHFQIPNEDHSKIVFCPQGAIIDVMVDLRKDSPTFKHFFSQELSAANHKAFYIPKGFAHGFKSLTDNTITCYFVSTEYSKNHDTGVRYDSIGFNWEIANPIISKRDSEFKELKDFESPF